jgi:hypothetical protein
MQTIRMGKNLVPVSEFEAQAADWLKAIVADVLRELARARHDDVFSLHELRRIALTHARLLPPQSARID